MAQVAESVMDPPGWAYYASAADDEVTLRENEAAFGRLWLRPRVLVDVSNIDTSAELLGVHPSTVRLWSDKGILPVHKTQGGHRRYKRSEILLWAEAHSKSRVNVLEPESMIQEVIKNVRSKFLRDGCRQNPGTKNWTMKPAHNIA